MKILVINAGSSSLKVQLFENKKSIICLYKGLIDRIGSTKVRYHETQKKKMLEEKIFASSHAAALSYIIKKLQKKNKIKNTAEIKIIGHRIVHGGEKYNKPVKINLKTIEELKKLCKFAPLHNPVNLEALKAARKLFPKSKHYAVFDTAFYSTLEPKAYLYALPYSYYQKYKIRRYGFHGTSHYYVGTKTIKLLKKAQHKIITCHLGNGSSITAIKNGKAIDTSMGFTPLEGIPMGTRSGDLDPALVIRLIEILKKTPNEIETVLNKESGLKGLSQLSSDMRDLWKASTKNKMAKLTIELLAYRIAKYIGSYTAALNGLDALTFTAGLGEKAYYLREAVCKYLAFLGLALNSKKNHENRLCISSTQSKIKVYVIPTDEEKAIVWQIIASKTIGYK